jgi:hypothetical protein
VFQSETVRLGQRFVARRSSVLKRFARTTRSGRVTDENSKFTHNTGRSAVADMTLSITHFGYDVAVFEIMSFVPRATTIAVVDGVRLWASTEVAALAVRPTLALMVALFHVPRARSLELREPKASVPTVRLSPMTNSVPCPLGPIFGEFRVVAAMTAGANVPNRTAAMPRLAKVFWPVRRAEEKDTCPLWQG